MALSRTSAIVTFGLAVGYYILRAQAAQCTGLQCENYVGPSLLLPILVLVGAAVSGVAAVAAATARRQGAWLSLLAGMTLVSVLGPLASAAIWRNSPDTFVPVATALALLAPLGALVFSFVPWTMARVTSLR